MSALLLRFLPHGLAVAAILGALWWLDHRGYQRAQADARFERAVNARMLLIAARQVETKIAEEIGKQDAQVATASQIIERNRTIIQPTITREIASVPRLSDPAAGITDGLLASIDRVRREIVTCARRPDGGISCPLPEPAAADGQDHRRADGGPS